MTDRPDRNSTTGKCTLTIWSIRPAQSLGRLTWMLIGVAILYATIWSSDEWINSWWPAAAIAVMGLVGAFTEGSIDKDNRHAG